MTPRHLWRGLLAGAALAAAPASGLAAGRQSAPSIYIVTLAQMKFGPIPKSIRVGDSIEWVNRDIFVHSATAADGSFDVELKPKAHLWTTFHHTGAYRFACRYHPGMTGTLVVTNQGG